MATAVIHAVRRNVHDQISRHLLGGFVGTDEEEAADYADKVGLNLPRETRVERSKDLSHDAPVRDLRKRA